MSYDVCFKVKIEGIDKYIDTGYCDANITWNVGQMIRKSTGLQWKNEQDNGLVSDIIPFIEHGYNELVTHREKYLQYQSPNGWGTVTGCTNFFRNIIQSYEQMDEQLAKVAHFFIQ